MCCLEMVSGHLLYRTFVAAGKTGVPFHLVSIFQTNMLIHGKDSLVDQAIQARAAALVLNCIVGECQIPGPLQVHSEHPWPAEDPGSMCPYSPDNDNLSEIPITNSRTSS